jgi:hypothetical protein
VSESPQWIKSSYTAGHGNCVEVAALPDGARAVRDSKDPAGPVLSFGADAWRAFTATLKH